MPSIAATQRLASGRTAAFNTQDAEVRYVPMVLCFDKRDNSLISARANITGAHPLGVHPSRVRFIITYVDPGLGAALASSGRTAHR